MILAIVIVVVAVVGAAAAGFGVAIRLAVAQVRRHAAADRDDALRSALEQAALVNQQVLAAQSQLHVAELTSKKDSIATGLAQVQAELTRELTRVNDAVSRLQRDSAESLGGVQAQLRAHAETTQMLSTTTQSLREALASTRARGQWGERMADDILRLAGFVEHVNYEKQVSVEEGTGIPDFTFLLPKGHVLYMDVKFPLSAYLRFLDASTDAERSAHRAAFLRDVKLRIKELASRQYSHGDRSAIGEVLLFIPNESISGFIHEQDPTLVEDALRQRIVLCSPLTLFALLAVIRQAYDSFMVEQTSDEILGLLVNFSSQYERFTGAIDLVGKRLESTQRAFDELSGTRRRQLERPLVRIEELRRTRGLPIEPVASVGAEVVGLEGQRVEELGA